MLIFDTKTILVVLIYSQNYKILFEILNSASSDLF